MTGRKSAEKRSKFTVHVHTHEVNENYIPLYVPWSLPYLKQFRLKDVDAAGKGHLLTLNPIHIFHFYAQNKVKTIFCFWKQILYPPKMNY